MQGVQPRYSFIDFILKEWLLVISGVGVVLTSIYSGHLPAYSLQELEVLFILFALFVVVQGLQKSGLIAKYSKRIEQGRHLPLKLVVTTFFLSMLVTNDVVLIVTVPLTLSLNIKRKDILVILQALAANAGSALTPFGNPQNLYIYWFYDLSPARFILSIAPFSGVFLLLLVLFSLIIETDGEPQPPSQTNRVEKSAYIYGLLFFAVLLTVLRLLPVATPFLVFLYALLFDRKALRVDYALLISFFFFFGFAENIRFLLASELQHSDHIFLFSVLTSQIMSNVPVALLFAKFTSHWEPLLWGTNAGGFGSLFGSLANLIAYKLYVNHAETENTGQFTAKFLLIGYAAFFVSIGLYFAIRKLS